MTGWHVWMLVWIGVPLLVGVFAIGLPRVTRHGLLFGVYVGSDVAASNQAREPRRTWDRNVCVLTFVTIGLGLALLFASWSRLASASVRIPALVGFPLCLAVSLVGLQVCYSRAKRMARRLAPPQPSPPAVAHLTPTKPGLVLPALVTLIAIAVGLLCLANAWRHYDQLPERWPMHVKSNGEGSAWIQRSLTTVMIPPLLALALGGWVGAYAYLVARAKVAVRVEESGVSLRAQERFRTLQTWFYCGLSLLTTAGLSVGSLRMIAGGLGHPERWQYTLPVLGAVILVYAVAGFAYMGLRVGQGGAKLEGAAAQAPLANGLADNRKWRLGAYVNPDDPSLFVEDRFGLGYGPNWGNPKAVAFFAGGLLLIVAMLVTFCWGVLAG